MLFNRRIGARWALTLTLSLTGIAGAYTADRRLVDAVEKRDKEAVASLLRQRIDVTTTQPDGATSLHWAAHWDDLEIADRLIRAGARVNAVNDLGASPLYLACVNGSATMVERLLRGAANANAALPSGETVLMTAARTGNVRVVRALLDAGADPNAKEHRRGQTALMWAVAEGHRPVVELLIAKGADMRARSTGGTTAFLVAARYGDLGIARVLLAAGAEVNDAEPLTVPRLNEEIGEAMPRGNTALLLASAGMLAASGFEYAVSVKPSDHEALALLLVEKGADVTKADSIGTTALHAAVQTGKARLVSALLARAADPNAKLVKAPPPLRGDFVGYPSYAGATPFWLAAAARVPNLEIIRTLTAAGADPNATSNDGSTPLMAAVGMVQNDARLAPEADALEVVNLLVQLGADVNAVDRSGDRALHGAVQVARDTIVRFLAEHGADLDAKNKQGRTPLALASDPLRPRESTANLLRELAAASPR